MEMVFGPCWRLVKFPYPPPTDQTHECICASLVLFIMYSNCYILILYYPILSGVTICLWNVVYLWSYQPQKDSLPVPFPRWVRIWKTHISVWFLDSGAFSAPFQFVFLCLGLRFVFITDRRWWHPLPLTSIIQYYPQGCWRESPLRGWSEDKQEKKKDILSDSNQSE